MQPLSGNRLFVSSVTFSWIREVGVVGFKMVVELVVVKLFSLCTPVIIIKFNILIYFNFFI